MQTGAISVPLFTLFGPDALRLRVGDCEPAILITNAEKAELARSVAVDGRPRVVVADEALLAEIGKYPATYDAQDARQRHGGVPVHQRHHARAAGSGQALASHARHADVRRALWHRHPAQDS